MNRTRAAHEAGNLQTMTPVHEEVDVVHRKTRQRIYLRFFKRILQQLVDGIRLTQRAPCSLVSPLRQVVAEWLGR